MTTLSGPNAGPGEGPAGESGVLTALLRTYIEKRDRSALDAFSRLLYDQEFADLAIQVHSYGDASDVTVKEVIDDALARFLEDLLTHRWKKAPKSAHEHVKWILRQKFIDRRRYHDKEKGYEDVRAHEGTVPDPQAPRPDAEAAAREAERILDQRLEKALSELGERDEKILRFRLQGLPYAEIGRRLGISEHQMSVYAPRAADQLLKRFVECAPTMAIRIAELQKARAAKEPEHPWPTLEDIERALGRITERVRDVVGRIHLRGESRESVAKEYGEAATNALLLRGYDLLEAKLKVSFPEAFEHAKP